MNCQFLLRYSIYKMITWLLLLFPVSVVLLSLLKRRRKRKGNEPPLIKGWIPWIGCGLDFRRNALGFLQNLQKKHGSIFTVAMGGRCFTFITDARDYSSITKISHKLSFKKAVGDVSGRVFHLKNHSDLPRGREIFSEYLHGNGLEDLDATSARIMQETITKKISIDWTQTGLLQLCHEILFPSVFRTLFDQDGDCEDASMSQAMRDFRHFDNMFVRMALGTASAKLEAAERLWSTLNKLSELGRGHDMIKRRDEVLRQKSYESRIGKEALSILWASLSNSVTTLFWALHFVLRDPSALRDIRNEIDTIRANKCKDDSSSGDFTMKELGQMRLLDCAIKETMRLTSSSMSARKILDDVEFYAPSETKIIRLRKDDILFMPYQLTHSDPEIYENPAEFRHDRFLTEAGASKDFFKKCVKVHGYLKPFGDGPSLCPGRYWAQLMIKRAFIAMLENFDIRLSDASISTPTIDRFGFGILHPNVDENVLLRTSRTDSYCT